MNTETRFPPHTGQCGAHGKANVQATQTADPLRPFEHSEEIARLTIGGVLDTIVHRDPNGTCWVSIDASILDALGIDLEALDAFATSLLAARKGSG